jgi:hypothetical protein
MTYGQELLYNYLKVMIDYDEVLIDHRPDWLFGMELDFYFPKLNIAFEFQGHQHFAPSEKYGSCEDQKWRDKQKKKICEEYKISLVTVDASELEYTRLTFKIKQAIKKFKLNKKLRVRYERRNTDVIKKLKDLNKLSANYRKLLRENYDDVTSYRKNSIVRKNAMRKAYKNI